MYPAIAAFIATVFFINLFFFLLNQKNKIEDENKRLREENNTLALQNSLLSNSVTKKKNSPLCERQLIKDFTDAELRVACLLVEGLEDKEIAGKLRNSTFTINSHVRNMREKANCRNTKELIAYLLRNEIV
jgi:DNA-binding NarL/FixJ family response regulator